MEEESPVIQAVRRKVREWVEENNPPTRLFLTNMNIFWDDSLQRINTVPQIINTLPADILTGCSGLQHIYLFNNQLTELPADIFTGCSQLESIWLTDNQLTKLPVNLFTGCSQLKHVYLYQNRLTELPADLFTGCSQLEYISLYNNQLTKIPVDLFAECSQLKQICLSNNRLTEIPVNLFAKCSKLQYISFDKSIVYNILWSLPDLNKPNYYDMKLIDVFPVECALVKRFRRIVDDPLSYAWDVRRHVLIGMNYNIPS